MPLSVCHGEVHSSCRMSHPFVAGPRAPLPRRDGLTLNPSGDVLVLEEEEVVVAVVVVAVVAAATAAAAVIVVVVVVVVVVV